MWLWWEPDAGRVAWAVYLFATSCLLLQSESRLYGKGVFMPARNSSRFGCNCKMWCIGTRCSSAPKWAVAGVVTSSSIIQAVVVLGPGPSQGSPVVLVNATGDGEEGGVWLGCGGMTWCWRWGHECVHRPHVALNMIESAPGISRGAGRLVGAMVQADRKTHESCVHCSWFLLLALQCMAVGLT